MKRSTLLKILIKQSHPSFLAFAKEADIPYTTLKSLLDNGVGNARVDSVTKICNQLGLTISDLNTLAKTEDIFPKITPEETGEMVLLMSALNDNMRLKTLLGAAKNMDEQDLEHLCNIAVSLEKANN